MIGGIAGAICAAGTVALAGTGIGGVFNLGVENTVDGQTQLRGNTGGNPQLRVTNQQGTDAAIGVLGTHSAAGGKGAGVQGETASGAAGAAAVLGRVTSATSAGDSAAVKGVNLGTGYGVTGSTTNAAGLGVYGLNTGVGGTGVRGLGGNGGWFSSSASNGTGALGTVTGAGHGVRGEAGTAGSGVRGIGGNGGWFSSAIANGTGVLGTVTGAGHGVRGEAGITGSGIRGIGGNGGSFSSSVANGTGVVGTVTGAGHGVRGEAGFRGSGVVGKAPSGGWAFSAAGNATQQRDSGGWFKAMAYIDPSKPAGQQVVRCFNSQVTGVPNCRDHCQRCLCRVLEDRLRLRGIRPLHLGASTVVEWLHRRESGGVLHGVGHAGATGLLK